MQRSFENGEIRERFRTLKPRKSAPGADQLLAQARAFTFHEVEGEEGPEEHIDLPGLLKADRT